MRPHGLTSDGKSEAKARSIGAASFAKGLKQIALAVGNASALVFDFDDAGGPRRHAPERVRDRQQACA